MFKQLESLIKERPVTISLTMKGDKIAFLVAPKKLADDENPAFWTPFFGCDTADALDANLASVLQSYVDGRAEVTQSLNDSLKQIQDQIKEAAEAAKKAAAAKLKRPANKVAPAGAACVVAGEDDDEEGVAQPPVNDAQRPLF